MKWAYFTERLEGRTVQDNQVYRVHAGDEFRLLRYDETTCELVIASAAGPVAFVLPITSSIIIVDRNIKEHNRECDFHRTD